MSEALSNLLSSAGGVISANPWPAVVVMFAAGRFFGNAFDNDCAARREALNANRSAKRSSIAADETFGRTDLTNAPPCLAAAVRNREDSLEQGLNTPYILVNGEANAPQINPVHSKDLLMSYSGEKVVSSPY